MTCLLDGNALVAMSLPGHALFARTHRWLATLPSTDLIATCPITEGTLLRIHMQQAFDRSTRAAWTALRSIRAHPRHVFWAQNFSHTEIAPTRLTGHRQLSDA